MSQCRSHRGGPSPLSPQHGANERHVDGQNRTPLHWAGEGGDTGTPQDVGDTRGPPEPLQ